MADKPIVTPYTPPIMPDIQPYRNYLPTAFDTELSMLEKVNKIIQALQDLNNAVGSVGSQWNDVMDWLMSEGLSEDVVNQLMKWKNDGTLDEIINQTILGSKATVIVSDTEPTNKDLLTFWFQTNASFNYSDDPMTGSGYVIVSDNEPDNKNVIWYDPI